MDLVANQKLKKFLKDALHKHGDHEDFSDDESLFLSGRLDSFSMMNLVMFLEETFHLNFSEFEFDVDLVDSFKAIELLIASKTKQVGN
jgi:acyl carrier protein